MQVQQKKYTSEEYLIMEEAAGFRSEYWNGEIVPMTGGSINHNRIAGTIHAYLKFARRGKNWEPFITDLRVWIPRYRRYTYPDVFVIQAQPVFQERRTDTVMNPCLIIEVLSKSTQDYDKTDKFRAYRSIPEFQEYLLVSQYETYVEHHTKTNDGWIFREYESDSAIIYLSSIGVEIAIADIYEGVTFESEPETAVAPENLEQ
ncbi:Uma2 family endonuclease [Phormidium sp. CLA17]|uniref:Uma2 family endonuclease n=1 Tax=Leptolyngbya sp. Cla-17 TaxID=2803751 RepID=UPI0014911227|nr:Uma2 family endonuclease [Leptolyngbya sp. Cla-17]MBM0743101.1 Uma2 family endonuclease [Leptolyngbya sp. Cla-17]